MKSKKNSITVFFTYLSYLIVSLMFLNVVVIFLLILNLIPAHLIIPSKYLSSWVGIAFSIYLVAYFYMGYHKGIHFEKRSFIQDLNRLKDPNYLIFMVVGIIMLIFFIYRLLNIPIY